MIVLKIHRLTLMFVAWCLATTWTGPVCATGPLIERATIFGFGLPWDQTLLLLARCTIGSMVINLEMETAGKAGKGFGN